MHPLSFLGLFTASLGQCVLNCPYLAFFLSPTLLGQCALHCPSRAVFCPALLGTVLCTAPLGHYVLHCSSWVLVPCPSGALCSALPFLGHCPSGALCSALSLLGYDLHCPFGGTALLGYCVLYYPSGALYTALPFCGTTASLGQCAMHCPFWSVFLHCPSLAPCYVLPFWAMLCLPPLPASLGQCALH